MKHESRSAIRRGELHGYTKLCWVMLFLAMAFLLFLLCILFCLALRALTGYGWGANACVVRWLEIFLIDLLTMEL
jgi:hypothetical protein